MKPRAAQMDATPVSMGVSGSSRAGRLTELRRHALRATALLKAMSSTPRLLVLCQLAEGERSVGDLVSAIGLSQSALSQHLGLLRRGNVVVTRRDGQKIFYSLASEEAVILMRALHGAFCGRAGRRAMPRPRLKVA